MQFVPLWTCILKSKKVGKMPPDVFRFWVFCLVSAQDHDHRRGTLPRLDDLAYSLHMPEKEAESLMSRLVTLGFVTERDGCYSIHDWQDWRYSPDPNAAERKRRQRAREAEAKATPDVTGVTPVTEVTEDHGCHALTEQSRAEQRVRHGVTVTRPPAPDDAPLIAIAAERWGASNGDSVVGDLLRTFEPALVRAAMDRHFDKYGNKLKPALLRGTCQGMFNDGWTPEEAAKPASKPDAPLVFTTAPANWKGGKTA